MEIRRAESEFEIEEARHLFRDYQQSLGVPLCFQKFEEEIASLPGYYSPPEGVLLVAWFGDDAVGCGALRKLDEEGCCEMKRLYVRPNFRRLGLGRELALRLMEAGVSLGYRRMKLDTLRTLEAAMELYMSLGFKEIEAYYENPLAEVVYLGRELSS